MIYSGPDYKLHFNAKSYLANYYGGNIKDRTDNVVDFHNKVRQILHGIFEDGRYTCTDIVKSQLFREHHSIFSTKSMKSTPMSFDFCDWPHPWRASHKLTTVNILG